MNKFAGRGIIKKNKSKESEKGAMTVEAVIALPVFLLFFMFMMYMVNICTLYLSLNHIADQTSKYNANSIYVYTTFMGKTEAAGSKTNQEQVMEAVTKLLDEDSSVNSIILGFFTEKVKKYLSGIARDNVQDYYYQRTEDFVENLIIENGLAMQNTKITLFKLPKGELQGDNKSNVTDSVFDENDIVIQLTYKKNMELPLIGNRDFNAVATCVERAWVNGANTSEYVDFESKSFFEKLGE